VCGCPHTEANANGSHHASSATRISDEQKQESVPVGESQQRHVYSSTRPCVRTELRERVGGHIATAFWLTCTFEHAFTHHTHTYTSPRCYRSTSPGVFSPSCSQTASQDARHLTAVTAHTHVTPTTRTPPPRPAKTKKNAMHSPTVTAALLRASSLSPCPQPSSPCLPPSQSAPAAPSAATS
jgi:hypothetical protein